VALKGVGLLVGVLACSGLAQFSLYTAGCCTPPSSSAGARSENGWSLFAVGIVSAVVQGFLLGRLLKRFGPQRLAMVGLVSSSLAYAGLGPGHPGLDDVRGDRCQPAGRGGVGRDAEPGVGRGRRARPGPDAGRGVQPQQPDGGGGAGAGRTAAGHRVAPAHSGDWRIGAPMFFCAALLQAAALVLAVLHFRRQARRNPWSHPNRAS
jgi:DHA1 family tetracycline resistance protein-like MFS transporter